MDPTSTVSAKENRKFMVSTPSRNRGKTVKGKALQCEVIAFQSNHEGALIDKIHAMGRCMDFTD